MHCSCELYYCDIVTVYKFRWRHENKSHEKEQKKGRSLERVQSQHMEPVTLAKLVWKLNGKEGGCSWRWPAFPWYCVQFGFVCVQPVCRRKFWSVVRYPESWTSPPRRSWRNSAWNRKCSSRGGVWRVRMATVNFIFLKGRVDGGRGRGGVDSSNHKFETVGYKAVKAEGWRSFPPIVTQPKPSPVHWVYKRWPPTMAKIWNKKDP